MKEERLFVLKMLNERKITADEACRLIKALNRSGGTGEFGKRVSKYAGNIKNSAVNIAKNTEPTVKKYAEAVSDKYEDIKNCIINKKKTDNADDEIIIVDETTDGEAEIISDNEPNA